MMEFFDQLQKMRLEKEPFALATVVRVLGSASAKTGSKAVFSQEGKNLAGWVGGGCAEAMVARNAREAIVEGVSRVIEVDLDDEIFGAGVPCGGKMEVYIEPFGPRPHLTLPRGQALTMELARLADHFGHTLSAGDSLHAPGFRMLPAASQSEGALLQMAEAIARSRGFSWVPWRIIRATGGDWASPPSDFRRLLILGRGRIVEECARLAALASWPAMVLGHGLERRDYPVALDLLAADGDYANFHPEPGDYIIFASHHSRDTSLLAKALAAKVAYAGFVASEKRTRICREELRSQNISLDSLYAPAGLELRSRNPGEIALSLFAEMIWLRRGGANGN